MIKKSTLKRAKLITEQPELFRGKDFGIPKVTGEKFYKAFVAPEVGGYQMPGVGKSLAPAAAAVMYQQALQRGAGPGAVMGAAGGAAGGAGFGALAGQQVVRTAQAKAREEAAQKLEMEREAARKEGRPEPKAPKARRLKGLGGMAAQLGAASIGAGLGSAIGAVAGGAEGFLGGRSSGAGILGGGVAGGGAAGLAAGIGSMIPATGKGTFAWPALAVATGAGFLGSEVMSSIVKNVEATRKRLALGGAEGAIFPQGPIAQRTG